LEVHHHRRHAKGFQFPPGEQEPAQIWTALRLDPANPGNRGGHIITCWVG